MNNKISKQSQNKISTDQDSDAQMDCSCQILNDTQLQNVSDSSCSCSQCMQANLNAFNQFKQTELKQKLTHAKSLDKFQSKRKTSQQGKQTKKNLRNTGTRYGRESNMSLNKKTQPKSYLINGQQQSSMRQSGKKYENDFTLQNLNDYIMITKQRTRQYLNQRNKINKLDKKAQQDLKQKIKQNLQILKYTVKAIQQKQPKLSDLKEKQIIHNFKWNHAPTISKKLKEIKQYSKQKLQMRKTRHTKVDTNLQKLIPQFSQNPSEFLEIIKQKRLEQFKQCKGCPYDHCPNHHMRTSEQKLKQIEHFIRNKVKKYNEKKKKQKLKQQENEKIKKAKLRAIDLKCKQILKRSKKYDPSESRTSFHLSIDHFSTFSDLRAHKKEKDEQKAHIKQIKKQMKQKGGKYEQTIYEDVFQNQLPVQQKVKINNKKQIQIGLQKQYCQKITKQAKIRSPRNIKVDDEKYKKQKQLQKNKNKMNLNEQKKKSRAIALQIQRKKNELMQQYKKQKQMRQSKNEKIKNQYKQSLTQSRR